jgi:hypothetical protein
MSERDVDDLTHYMQATARLRAERDRLRAVVERAEYIEQNNVWKRKADRLQAEVARLREALREIHDLPSERQDEASVIAGDVLADREPTHDR